MHFQYCPHCGKKAERKQIGDEGLIPYCTQCEVPLWDMFTTSIIAAVVNECGEIALLRQNYVSQTNHVCVAGIMKLGESAEETVIREVGEELGLKVKSVEFVKSYPYEKKEMPTPQRLRSWLVPRPSQKSLRPKARGQVSGGYCGGFWQWTRCQSL